MNLDIDSYDLFVLEAIFEGGFRPRLVSMEINEKIPPPLDFTVLFDEEHFWLGDHFYGCSLVAANNLMARHDYGLFELKLNNAIFVDFSALPRKRDWMNPDEAYKSGYRNHPDRWKLFPWNTDVDELLSLQPEEAVDFVHRLFLPYQGKYRLRIHESWDPKRAEI